MSMMGAFQGPASSLSRAGALAVLRQLGLANTLHFCLDAGDDVSAPAGTSKWVDLTGNGNGFFRGNDGTAEGANDMDFVGTAGDRAKTTYWENITGPERFTFEKANTTALQDAHKTNQSWTYCAWVYIPTSAIGTSVIHLAQGGSNTSAHGFAVNHFNTQRLGLVMTNGTAGTAFVTTSITSSEYTPDRWNFFGLAVSTTAGSVNYNVHAGARQSSNVTPTMTGTISATNASQVAKMHCSDTYVTTNPAGCRRAIDMFFTSKLTLEQLTEIFNATRGRFGV